MAGLEVRDFSAPDETRAPDKTKVAIVRMGGTSASHVPRAGLALVGLHQAGRRHDSCQVHHVGVMVSGALHVAHEDGTEHDIGTGQAYVIEPGHDAWVVGKGA